MLFCFLPSLPHSKSYAPQATLVDLRSGPPGPERSFYFIAPFPSLPHFQIVRGGELGKNGRLSGPGRA